MLHIILGGLRAGDDFSLLFFIIFLMTILFVAQKIVPLIKKFIHERFVH